jgi:hypothetical protein
MSKHTSFSAWTLATALSLWAAALSAATPIDPSGIYLANVFFNASPVGPRNYLTINRNGDRYVVVNISQNLYYLSDLMLILTEEAENNSIAPPIEEFALTFATPDGSGGVMPQWDYRLEPVIPFPRATAYLSAELPAGQMWDTSVYRTILFGEAGTGACLQSDRVIIIRRCYTKIF